MQFRFIQFIRSIAIALFGIGLILFGMRDVSARGPGSASTVTDPKADFSTTQSTHEAVTETEADGSLKKTKETHSSGIGRSQPGRHGETFPYTDSAPTTQSGRNTRMAVPRQSPTPR